MIFLSLSVPTANFKKSDGFVLFRKFWQLLRVIFVNSGFVSFKLVLAGTF